MSCSMSEHSKELLRNLQGPLFMSVECGNEVLIDGQML